MRAAAVPVARTRVRFDSIDLIRGLVMALMVLDHARGVYEPLLFLTQWATRSYAPVFVLLAGVSAFLYGSWGRTTRELSVFLFTRGVFLVLLDMALVRLGGTFNPSHDGLFFQAIGVIGASLVVLSALVYLPQRAIAAIGLAIVLAHQLLDGIRVYPLIPWVGVMALGYALGPVMVLAPQRRWLLAAGAATTLAFVVLRFAKYRARGALARALVTIGRVPLAFYVLHLFLLHAVAAVTARVWHGDTQWLAYAVWIAALAALYPVCRGFAELKQRRADAWLSYL